MSHRVNDMVSLALATEVSRGLREHPEWISLARDNISRWRRLNADSPSLLRCYDEWERLLQLPVDEVAKVLVQENDEGQRLRQNSPFAGAIHYRRVWQIKRETWALCKEQGDEPSAA
jgi:hypothetical protein